MRKRQSSACCSARPSEEASADGPRPRLALLALLLAASGCGQAGRKAVAARVPFQPRCREGACGPKSAA